LKCPSWCLSFFFFQFFLFLCLAMTGTTAICRHLTAYAALGWSLRLQVRFSPPLRQTADMCWSVMMGVWAVTREHKPLLSRCTKSDILVSFYIRMLMTLRLANTIFIYLFIKSIEFHPPNKSCSFLSN
jgi:hypothetical protein